MAEQLRSIGYYYPEPLWLDPEWIKSMLLFFDGVSLLVPDYMRDRVFERNPETSIPLFEQGLLTILEPETMIDSTLAEDLSTVLVELITSGVFDDLDQSPFAHLSYSRMGYTVQPGLAGMVHDELVRRGLAGDVDQGLAVPMHPTIRSAILVLLCQMIRRRGRDVGANFQPITDRPEVVAALTDLLGLPRMRSAGNVIATDLEVVSVDLSGVPLDEVLSYREAHGVDYRRYAESLRQFVTGLPEDSAEQDVALESRIAVLRDEADALRRSSRRAWGQKAFSCGLGCAGAAWTATTGDVIGGVLALAGSVGGFALGADSRDSAYTYVLDMHRNFLT